MWAQSWAALRAHRGSYTGPFVVLVLAAALLSATGVLMESGLRGDAAAGLLTVLAGSFAGTALVVVVLVVASTVTLAMRQRRRELALLRAVGATRTQVRRRVGAELMLLTALAAPLGAIPGLWLARTTRPLLVDAGVVGDDFRFTLSPLPVLVALLLLAPLSVLAARLAARETLRLPPTAAVRSTTVEERAIGGVRRVAAAVTAALGLTAAGSGVAVPGTVGSASAATSALLLVAAAALAGPVLVTWALGRWRPTGAAPVRLAVANSRGFSRRLATAVVPLAAALALGTTQSSVDSAVGAASVEQLRDGIRADLVVSAPDGLSARSVEAVAAADGVARATPLAGLTAQVRTDDEEIPGLAALSWEAEALRVLPAGGAGPALDPGVTAGSLAALDEPGTVAVSSDARIETGHGMGDRVAVRLGDGPTALLEVVAVYDRGLGFGDYLVGTSTLAARDVTAPVDTVLVTTDDPVATATALADTGLRVDSPSSYAEHALGSGPQEQRLSLVLLLALLAFVGLGAANALVMSTAGRRDELALLARTGATRGQLVTMALVESLLVAGLAWAIGTLAVLPAVLGVSAGLLGLAVPVVDLTTYGVLSVAVLAIAVVSIVPTVALRVRR
jgi:putative ABC transport system permease protein